MQLPGDILRLTFNKLPLYDLIALSETCKQLNVFIRKQQWNHKITIKSHYQLKMVLEKYNFTKFLIRNVVNTKTIALFGTKKHYNSIELADISSLSYKSYKYLSNFKKVCIDAYMYKIGYEYLHNCRNLFNKYIKDLKILENFKNLDTYKLSEQSERKYILNIESVSCLKGLKKLCLKCEFEVAFDFISCLQCNNTLKQFSCNINNDFGTYNSTALTQQLTRFKNLEKLNIRYRFQNEDLQILSDTLTKLKSLKITNTSSVDLGIIARFKNLKSINLLFVNIMQGIEKLRELTQLEYLQIYYCSHIDYSVIEELVNLRKLEVCESISLGNLNFSKLVNLKSLKIYINNCTTNLVLPDNLQDLILNTTNMPFGKHYFPKELRKLDLSFCDNMQDNDLAFIAELEHIQEVKLKNDNITDNALQYLCKCKRINLNNCNNITIEGIKHLKLCNYIELCGCSNIDYDEIMKLGIYHISI